MDTARALGLVDVLPPAPLAPPGLTAPSVAYRRHAWLATLGVLAFVALYLGLTGYLGWVVARLLREAVLRDGGVGAALLALPAAFFLAFLVRGLLVVKRERDPLRMELNRADEPLLFEFLDRVADETGAPRPHRVFVSGRVNACVFYDLSFWTFFFPAKKNLELGLGLVHALTLDELKAVVAHEFGHFAQRTMAVGRWVYIAQQVAGHIVASRGAFDRVLMGLSRTDLRVAWIGWLMRLFVWAIRAVLDTGFRIVVLAHRALGREMELQADRVAVSVSGSDSLVHALYRLGPADEAWEEAVSFMMAERQAGRPIEDLFVLQTAALEHIRRVLAEPALGETPVRPVDAAGHRVFDTQLAQPPRMWLTHPPNREREDSAKATYLPSALDPRGAWVLFRNPLGLRRAVTQVMSASVPAPVETPTEDSTAAVEPLLDRFAKRFTRPSLDPRYCGVYLGRAIAAHHERPAAMVGAAVAPEVSAVREALGRLYPESLRADLALYRKRCEEAALLEGLSEGVLAAPGGVIRYRGRELRRAELPEAIDTVKAERKDIERRVLDHDGTARAAHLGAARLIGRGWPEYLESLRVLLHAATHTLRNLADAHAHLCHELGIALADGRVTSAERKVVLASAEDLFGVLEGIWAMKAVLELPAEVQTHFTAYRGWTVLGEKLGLLAPTADNLGDWLGLMDGWVQGALGDLKALGDAALDALLEAEHRLGVWVQASEVGEDANAGDGKDAPAPAVLPLRYATRVIGQERPKTSRLSWWDRFQTADGLVPGALRAAAACAVLVPMFLVGGKIGTTTVHVINGLGVPVTIVLGDSPAKVVQAHEHATIETGLTDGVHVATRTVGGAPVERFDARIGRSNVVYNVAQAAPLVEWTVFYGAGKTGRPPSYRALGAARWQEGRQDVFFAEPPRTVSVSRGGQTSRRVLAAPLDLAPGMMLSLVANEAEKQAMVAAHLRFDAPSTAGMDEWVVLGQTLPEAKQILRERVDAQVRRGEPRSVFLERAVQDLLQPAERRARCDEIRAESARKPEDIDTQYLAIRCTALQTDRTEGFLGLWTRHPDNPWLNWAVADDLAQQGRWQESIAAWDRALLAPALAPLAGGGLLEVLRTVRVGRAMGVEVPWPKVLTNGRPPGSMLSLVERIESPPKEDDGPQVKAYRALGAGRLEEALAALPAEPDEARRHLLILVAGSAGASRSRIEAVLGLPVEQAGSLAWVVAALQIREKRPSTALDRVRLTGAVRSALPEALAELGKSPRRMEALGAQLSLHERAVVLAMGVMVLGKQAPAGWRRDAKAGLFVFERPYFE